MGPSAADSSEPAASLRARVVGVLVRLLLGIVAVLFLLSILPRMRELHQLVATVPGGTGPHWLPGVLWAYPYVVLGLEIAFVWGFALVATLIWSRSGDRGAMLFALTLLSYAVWVTPTLDALVLPTGLDVVADLTQGLGLFLATQFFLLFPDGRYVPRWLRVSAPLWGLYCLAWALNPEASYSMIDPFQAGVPAFAGLLLGGWTVGLFAQAVRYRRAPADQRAQTKWVMLAIAAACVGYGTVYLTGLALPDIGSARVLYDLFGVPVFWLLALPMVTAFIVAMLRHQLFDVQFVLRRTLMYAVLTNVLALVYLATAAVLQLAVNPLTGGSQVAVAGSTLMVVVIFHPVRRRLQLVVDSRFNRTPYDAGRTVESFAGKVRDDVALGEVTNHLLGTIATTLQPTSTWVWLRSGHEHSLGVGGTSASIAADQAR